MKKKNSLLILIAIVSMSFSNDKPAYLLYDKGGKSADYSSMLEKLAEADIIFFGELHNDPIAHWLQFELSKDLFELKKDALMFGAEMFESDNQLVLNEYLAGRFAEDKFKADARLWKNYDTDYKPVVEFAKENELAYIATNIPRRYASMVHKKGFESLEELDDVAKAFIAPLPINYDPDVKCYKDMLSMDLMAKPSDEMKEKMVEGKKEMTAAVKMKKEKSKEKPKMEMPKHAEGGMGHGAAMSTLMNLPKAQAAKDATMAYFILQNWEEGKTMFHFNGSYHSNNFEGIVWHLLQENEDLNIMTIATVLQEEIGSVEDENLNIADYIICVPESMTRTNR